MTDTKQTMRDTLRQHGLPEAWAEWVTRIEIRNGRPEQTLTSVSRPEPPERTVTDYDEDEDDDGAPFERERTDDEMIAAWAEYGEAVKSWRAKYGDVPYAVVALAPSSEPYFTAAVTGNGATVKLSGGSDAGPWRVESTETIGGPRCVPVNPGEWITVLKEAAEASAHDYVPGFVAGCTFADAPPKPKPSRVNAIIRDTVLEKLRDRPLLGAAIGRIDGACDEFDEVVAELLGEATDSTLDVVADVIAGLRGSTIAKPERAGRGK